MDLYISNVLGFVRTEGGYGVTINERLNIETGGSKTPRIHWVARVNMK